MLKQLNVRNYVLIDSLEVAFPEGLVIITGQTGAGKSILLGALSLLLGAKADASAVGEGGDNCVVEALFVLGPDDPARKVLEENDLDWNGGELLIRRVVARSGRSRAFVNDEPVTLPLLNALAPRLVDIHSQHQTLLLSDHQFQLSLLDRYAGNSDLLVKCSAAWSKLNALRRGLEELEGRIERMERERDYNEAQWKQLDAAALKDGELEELEAEQKTLANAELIKELLGGSLALAGTAGEEGAGPLTVNLKEMERNMLKLSRFIPSAASLEERLSSCRIELEDILSEIESLDSAMDASPERLEAVEDRLSLLYSLMKKHAAGSISELVSLRDSLSESLADSTLLQQKRDTLREEINSAKDVYDGLCEKLHAAREKAAKPFAETVLSSLVYLELPSAVFSLRLDSAPCGASGSDSVTFLFSSSGKNPVDVARCASGGELSRIMLCLKDMMARYCSMPAMVFDEIDTGVSGSVADRMGSMICSMGSRMQVFAITHLPQVAAKGEAHYLVSKSTETGRMLSTIEKLSDEGRVMEIARMLSGSELTDAAIANARSLISKSRQNSPDRK